MAILDESCNKKRQLYDIPTDTKLRDILASNICSRHIPSGATRRGRVGLLTSDGTTA
jgi:hypothetical protein